MAERGFLGGLGGLGGILGNEQILWFIILFLLLFWGCRGPACEDGI